MVIKDCLRLQNQLAYCWYNTACKKETITFALNQKINVRYFITGRFTYHSGKNNR